MLSRKEIVSIIVVILVLAFSISLLEIRGKFLISLLLVTLVLGINILTKKIVAFYFDSEIEMKIWELQQYGFKPTQHLKKPIPIGALLPIISKILFSSINNLVWMASLVFDVKTRVHKAARRHGLYKFSEITEDYIGKMAASGIIANLLFAIIGYLIGFAEFSRLNIYYAAFNILPISNLDGNKILFGNLVLWIALATIISIGLLLTIFII